MITTMLSNTGLLLGQCRHYLSTCYHLHVTQRWAEIETCSLSRTGTCSLFILLLPHLGEKQNHNATWWCCQTKSPNMRRASLHMSSGVRRHSGKGHAYLSPRPEPTGEKPRNEGPQALLRETLKDLKQEYSPPREPNGGATTSCGN